jgi:hypothetical protein
MRVIARRPLYGKVNSFLLLAAQRLQAEVISIISHSLAFCVVGLLPVARRSLREAPFKRPDEAGSMPISYVVGNFLYA